MQSLVFLTYSFQKLLKETLGAPPPLVGIIRVISARTSSRVEQLHLLLTKLESYVGFPQHQVKQKDHEVSDLQCNFSHFRNHTRKFYHKIFLRTLILRAVDIFCSRHECCCCCSSCQARTKATKFSAISRKYFSRATKVTDDGTRTCNPQL